MIVPSSSLSEYSVRSLMSLEGRDPDTDEAMCLKNYIRPRFLERKPNISRF